MEAREEERIKGSLDEGCSIVTGVRMMNPTVPSSFD